MTIVSETNIIARNNVNVCDDLHSFDGCLEKWINTIFCERQFLRLTFLKFAYDFNNKKSNYFKIERGNHFDDYNCCNCWRKE